MISCSFYIKLLMPDVFNVFLNKDDDDDDDDDDDELNPVVSVA